MATQPVKAALGSPDVVVLQLPEDGGSCFNDIWNARGCPARLKSPIGRSLCKDWRPVLALTVSQRGHKANPCRGRSQVLWVTGLK